MHRQFLRCGANSPTGRAGVNRIHADRPPLSRPRRRKPHVYRTAPLAHRRRGASQIKGFDHESPLSPFTEHPPRVRPGVLDHVPPEFAACLQEPAFNIDMATFCIWRRPGDAAWQIGPVAFPTDAHDPDGPDPDGSEQMLSPLDGRAETYRAWAEEYYERKVDAIAVEQIFEHRPLTPELVAKLNPKASLAGLVDDIREIGYPVATE